MENVVIDGVRPALSVQCCFTIGTLGGPIGQLVIVVGVTRLADLPAEWSRQRRILGLASH
jgi:hypothetical protein